MTDLIDAVIDGNVELVGELLRFVDPNFPDLESNTALIKACQMVRRERIVRILIGHRADPNTTNDTGDTALMYAARNGSVKNVKSLLSEERTDINKRNHLGQTALLLAMLEQKDDVVAEFLNDPVVFSRLSAICLQDNTGAKIDLKYAQWLADAFLGNFHENPPPDMDRDVYETYYTLYTAMNTPLNNSNIIRCIETPLEVQGYVNASELDIYVLVTNFRELTIEQDQPSPPKSIDRISSEDSSLRDTPDEGSEVDAEESHNNRSQPGLANLSARLGIYQTISLSDADAKKDCEVEVDDSHAPRYSQGS